MSIAIAAEKEGDGGPEATRPSPGATILAPVVSVEVFRHSALVHREGELPPEGVGREPACYELPGLPLGLVDSSVRAALQPTDSGRIVDVQVLLDVQTPTEQAQVEELEQFKAIRHQLEQAQREQRRLREQGEAMAKLLPVLPPEPKRPDHERFVGDDPLAAWLALGGLVHDASADRLRRAVELGERLRELEDELKQTADRLERLSTEQTGRLHVGKRIRLTLAERPGRPCRVQVSYQVPGARWFPGYELRVAPDGSRAELVMTALVAQVSGEDWPDVALSLSTADLRRRCDLPRLGAWRIGRAAHKERRLAWRELPPDLPELFADFDRGRPEEPPPSTAPHSRRRGQEGSIAQMISSTLVQAGMASAPLAESPQGSARAVPAREEEEIGFSPQEITRETDLDEIEAEAADLEQAFEDEPTPQEALLEVSSVAASPMAGGAPPAAAAPAPVSSSMVAKRRSSRPAKRKREDRRRPPTLSPGATSLVPSDELLVFGTLVLAAPAERGRGMLRPLRSEERLPGELPAGQALQALEREEQQRASRLLELRTLAPPRGVRDVGESAGHFAYRYDVQARASLPADGALHRLAVLREALEAELVYRTIPALDDAAYRVARLENPLTVPLLAGPLDVFWGNEFLVSARLQTTAPGAVIEANLGVEPRLKTARNVRHSQHEEGLLSGRTVYEEELRIEVRSGLQDAAVVEVIERVPVTDERKVEVKLLEEKPPAAEYDQRERMHPVRGGRRWRLELAAGETGECLLRYSVTLPASSEIVGGGRRA